MPANETCEESLLVSQSAHTARSGKQDSFILFMT